MKKISNTDLFHRFANEYEFEGNGHGSVHCVDGRLYSYREPIACHTFLAGHRVLVVCENFWSVTTGKHIGLLKEATKYQGHRYLAIYDALPIADVVNAPTRISWEEYFEKMTPRLLEQARERVQKLSRARSQLKKCEHADRLNLIQQALRLLGVDIPEDCTHPQMVLLMNMKTPVVVEASATAQEALAEWREKGGAFTRRNAYAVEHLRIHSRSRLETTLSLKIPTWSVVQRRMQYSHGFPLGPVGDYTVDRVEKVKDDTLIHAGCHKILLSEVDRVLMDACTRYPDEDWSRLARAVFIAERCDPKLVSICSVAQIREELNPDDSNDPYARYLSEHEDPQQFHVVSDKHGGPMGWYTTLEEALEAAS